jgi:hypothetical protein
LAVGGNRFPSALMKKITEVSLPPDAINICQILILPSVVRTNTAGIAFSVA